MSNKSKSSKALDRPFAADVLRRARAIAERYQVVVWHEDGDFYGRGVELPLVMADGRTADACVAATRAAFVAAIATLLEKGAVVPPPASEGVRTEQVNVRLSAEEKLALETSAKQQGYRGLSDFVRAAALEKAG